MTWSNGESCEYMEWRQDENTNSSAAVNGVLATNSHNAFPNELDGVRVKYMGVMYEYRIIAP